VNSVKCAPRTAGGSWPQGDIQEARNQISAFAQEVTPAVRLDVVKEDPADNRMLECAVSAGAEYIVTGDQDLLRLGRYDEIRIVRVADCGGERSGAALT
jgi:predicted nucleic acid-binding protein